MCALPFSLTLTLLFPHGVFVEQLLNLHDNGGKKEKDFTQANSTTRNTAAALF